MKKYLNTRLLPWITLGAGFLGFLLRCWLFTKVDSKGLLPATHASLVLLFVVTGLFVAALALLVQPLYPIKKYSRLFPAGILRAVGCGAGAAGILSAVLFRAVSYNGAGDLLVILLGVLAACSLGYTAFLRLRGMRPALLMEAAVALFFVVSAIVRCRQWGTESQVAVYFFPLLACVGLMIHAYNLASAASRGGSRRMLVFFNQLTLFFCLVSLNETDWSFYLGMVIWLALDLCVLDRKKIQSPEEAV